MSDFMTALAAWQADVTQLAILKRREAETRKALFDSAFPEPEEGTQRRTLPNGQVLVGQYNVTRKIDEAMLQIASEAVRTAGYINADDLVARKPELVKSVWNKLTDTQKLAFSPAVIATPGAPNLKVEG